MSELKLTEKGKTWVREFMETLSDGIEKIIVLDAEQSNTLYAALYLWNTEQPRFSPEERETLETICRLSNLGMLQEYKDECFCDSKKFATINYTKHQKLLATVRTMLQEGEFIKHAVDCSTAEKQGGRCTGYGLDDGDDEPIDECKKCPQNSLYGEDD